jgi:hypothetical protein
MREIAAGGSYMSQNDLRAHFGLGSSKRIDSIEVTWPNGNRQSFRDVGADQFYVIEEGSKALKPQVIAGRHP